MTLKLRPEAEEDEEADSFRFAPLGGEADDTPRQRRPKPQEVTGQVLDAHREEIVAASPGVPAAGSPVHSRVSVGDMNLNQVQVRVSTLRDHASTLPSSAPGSPVHTRSSWRGKGWAALSMSAHGLTT